MSIFSGNRLSIYLKVAPSALIRNNDFDEFRQWPIFGVVGDAEARPVGTGCQPLARPIWSEAGDVTACNGWGAIEAVSGIVAGQAWRPMAR